MPETGSRYKSIQDRYTELSTESCCLSCGGALNFVDIESSDICLDLGSGRGNDVFRMADKANEGKVYGIDISAGMLKEARRTANEEGYYNVEFLNSPFERVPVEDSSVDVLISNCSINHAQNKEKVWAEIYRVIRPGGKFVVSDIYSTESVPAKYSSDPQAVAECWAGAVTRNEYMGIVVDAGFDRLKILEESKPYDKGKIEVASFTISGRVPKSK
ncbi:MAG: methyltransferase domain-containing protein [Elusimicrobiota bacterium]